MKIIAFGYKKGRGKDSCCNFMKDWLHRNHPSLRVRKVGFADKLKDVAHQLYGWAGVQPGIYYEAHYKEKEIVLPRLGLSPRDVWIGLGNGCRQVYGPTWIHFITQGGVKCDVLLIKDTGFTNEARAVCESGGLLYKVERDGPMGTDPREVELDTWEDFTGTLDNTGTLNDLNDAVCGLCEEIFA
jgi:hypothetical protein